VLRKATFIEKIEMAVETPSYLIHFDAKYTGNKKKDIPFKVKLTLYSPENEHIYTVKCVLLLTMLIDKSLETVEEWRNFWIKKEYDVNYFDAYWSKNIDMLNDMMDKASVRCSGKHHYWSTDTPKYFADLLNDRLIDLENDIGKNSCIYSSFLVSEYAVINSLLLKYDFPGLDFTRKGENSHFYIGF